MKRASSTAELAGPEPSPNWSAVGFMVDFHTREKRLGLLTETLVWVASVALFRRAEAETHYLGAPTERDQRYHKSLLAALVAGGERLLMRIQTVGGLPENLDGVKTQDIDAMVEELHNTQAQWYGSMTAERRAQILNEIFNVPPS